MKHQISILLASLVALSTAAPSVAQDLSGEWQFKRRAREGWHTGKLVIDSDGEVRQRGRSPMQDYAQCGHILVHGGGKIEIEFTSVKTGRGYSLDHFYCTLQGERSLRCFNIDGIGKEDDLFVIERIGRTPASPDGQMDGVCPARERPQV
ncbi:MAG: hypothetical protein ISP49_13375 [Reyranella sp.]|nr:hypothetical protein [Reyranella sp.]MBL6652581.1 hypothetical protein [Reyranella sp.]